MATMTKEQLVEHMKSVLLPLLKDTIGNDVKELVRENIEQMRTAAAPAAATATDAVKHLTGAGGQKTTTDDSRGLSFGGYVRAMAAGRNDKERAIKAARAWGYEAVAKAIESSVEKAMSAGDPTGGGFLVPPEFSQEVIELLRASAVVRSLNPLTIPMSSGSLKVPRITEGSQANYIGENVNIPKSRPRTGQLTLTFKKLAALVPVSNDLIRYASPSADSIVRDDMIRAMSAREDLAFIRDNGLDGKPKGLKEWIASSNKFASSGGNLDQTTSDLGNAIQLLMDANINLIVGQGGTGAIDVRPGWLFSPRHYKHLTTIRVSGGGGETNYAFRDEMLRGTLWGFPYRVTTQVENDTVYFGAFAHAVIGEALSMIVDASQEAAYHDGTSVVSSYSTDQTVIRVISEHDFALRHDRAFALVTGVTWGA